MATTYLESDFTGTGASGPAIATYSFWVKLELSDDRATLVSGKDNGSYLKVRFADDGSGHYLGLYGSSMDMKSARLFRDPAAWYHVVMAFDTGQAAAADRIKVWINNEQITDWPTDTRLAQNDPLYLTKADNVQIGAYNNTEHFDGIMAHVHCCDGTAYTPTDFAETDSTSGIWVPKTSPSVTYGTKGYFLKFASGAEGTDSSGNGNDFTVNGTMTNTKDTPQNNFCTMSLISSTTPTANPPVMSDGNLTLTDASSSGMDWGGYCTQAVTKGKWYWEVKNVEYNSNNVYHGLGQLNIQPIASGSGSAGNFIYAFRIYNADGSVIIYGNGATESTSTTTVNGDIFGIKMDLDNGYWYLSKNGTFLNSGNAINGTQIPTSDTTWYSPQQARHQNTGDPNITSYNFGNGYFGTTAITTNSGAGYADDAGEGKFNYTVPTGYYALCTNNIATYG